MAELIGGIEPARTIMLKLLESGKDIVTANKALLAEHGPELFDRARELGRSIAFEASVAGGVPIIANISQCLSANQITSLHGDRQRHQQLHPLRRWKSDGLAYADAVKEAQRRGYAEADPTHGRGRHRRRAEAGDPRPPGLRGPGRTGRTFRGRASTRWMPADMRYAQRAGLSDQAAGRRARWSTEGWNCTSRPRWSASAVRWPRCGRRSTRSASSATAVGPVFFHGLGRRADADGLGRRGRHDRHGRRPHATSRSARWNCGPTANRAS